MNDFPFEIKLPANEKIVESYKGVHIAVSYELEAILDAQKVVEPFFLQVAVLETASG